MSKAETALSTLKSGLKAADKRRAKECIYLEHGGKTADKDQGYSK